MIYLIKTMDNKNFNEFNPTEENIKKEIQQSKNKIITYFANFYLK